MAKEAITHGKKSPGTNSIVCEGENILHILTHSAFLGLPFTTHPPNTDRWPGPAGSSRRIAAVCLLACSISRPGTLGTSWHKWLPKMTRICRESACFLRGNPINKYIDPNCLRSNLTITRLGKSSWSVCKCVWSASQHVPCSFLISSTQHHLCAWCPAPHGSHSYMLCVRMSMH